MVLQAEDGGVRPGAVRSGTSAEVVSAGRVNNVNVALDPVTGQTLPNAFVGTFVPGTGDPYNGMVTSDDPDYPRGFRETQGIEPAPRLGVAWDILGDGSTSLHASTGLYYNAFITGRSMDSAANNPPAVNTPTIIYGTMDSLLQGAAFSSRPSNVFGLERDAKTPRSYNWSIGSPARSRLGNGR